MRYAALALIAALAAGSARAAELRDLCPDRPAKGTSPCTVDQGHLQLEVDLADTSWDRSGGVKTVDSLWAAPTLKYGLTGNLDLEAAWTPYERISERGPGAARDHQSGVGDLVFKAKLNPTGNPKDGPSLALIPYLKAPIASRQIGDGAWEEGLIGALAAGLPGGWSLNLTPEFDRLLNGAGSGRRAAASVSLGLTHAIGGGVSATGELWEAKDWDPGGHSHQASADVALAWIPTAQPSLQLDIGLNLGLNRQTPRTQAYLGVARRF